MPSIIPMSQTGEDSKLSSHKPKPGEVSEGRNERIEAFTQSYDLLVNSPAHSTFGRNGLWSRVLGRMPIFGSYFQWRQPPAFGNCRRDSLPKHVDQLYKPGILSLRILVDTVLLLWLGFQDAAPSDDDDFDPTAGCENGMYPYYNIF